MDQFLRQVRLGCDVVVDTIERFGALGGDLGAVHAGHVRFSFLEDTVVRSPGKPSLLIQLLRASSGRPRYGLRGAVRTVSSVSTTKTASSFAGSVFLALALTSWRSPSSSVRFSY